MSRAFGLCSMMNLTRPNWPAARAAPGSEPDLERDRTVSVSTLRSTASRYPGAGCTVPSARISWMGIFSARTTPRACCSATRLATLKYSASAMPARNRIGSICEMVTRACSRRGRPGCPSSPSSCRSGRRAARRSSCSRDRARPSRPPPCPRRPGPRPRRAARRRCSSSCWLTPAGPRAA